MNSGYEMPTQGLGTYALDYATCTSSIHALAAAGGRLIDTAYMYHNEDAVSYIQSLGIVVEGWYPLGGRGHNDELLADPELTVIAQARGVSVPQVILRWNRQRGIVVIPGSSNPAHIAEDLDIHGFSLTEEEMARISALDRAEKHDWY